MNTLSTLLLLALAVASATAAAVVPVDTTTTVAFLGNSSPDDKTKKPTFALTQDTYAEGATDMPASQEVFVVVPQRKESTLLPLLHLTVTYPPFSTKDDQPCTVVDHLNTGSDFGDCTVSMKQIGEKNHVDYTVKCVGTGKGTDGIPSLTLVKMTSKEGYFLKVDTMDTSAFPVANTFVKPTALATATALAKVFGAATTAPKKEACEKQIKDATEKIAKKADGLANDLADRANVPVWAVYTLAGVTVVLVFYFLKLLLCGCGKKKQTKEQQKLEQHKQYQNLDYA